MDTKRLFLVKDIKDFPDKIVLPEIDIEVTSRFKLYISFFSQLQGIYQLFDIFLFNLDQLEAFCTMYYNDQVINSRTGKSVTLIEMNGLLINVIAAGKSLVEGIESFLNTEVGHEELEVFKQECIRKKYDEEFSFRFLITMRNLSQHGTLPVSQNVDGRFCFDLAQIIDTPHFSFSKSITESMKSVYEELVVVRKTRPNLAVTYTLDTYVLSVIEIYDEFMKRIRDKVRFLYEDCQNAIEQHPEWVYREEGCLCDMVIYDVEEDGNMNCFSWKDNAWNWYLDRMEYANKMRLYYRQKHHTLNDISGE